MNKKKIIVIVGVIVAVLAIIGICIAMFALSANDDIAEQQSAQQEANMNQNNTNNSTESISNGVDSIVNEQSGNISGGMSTSSTDEQSSDAANNYSGGVNDGGSNTSTTSTLSPETQNTIHNFIVDSFGGDYLSNAATSIDEIPSVSRNDDNWVYLTAQGGDLNAIMGGAHRINVNVEKMLPVSNTPAGELYKVEYTFTAHHTEAMDAGGVMDMNARSTAVVRIKDGKIVEYSETLDWLV